MQILIIYGVTRLARSGQLQFNRKHQTCNLDECRRNSPNSLVYQGDRTICPMGYLFE